MTKFARCLAATAGLAATLAMGAVAPGMAAPFSPQPVAIAATPVIQAGLFSRTERTPQQELQRILKVHYYYGGNVGQSIRAAAGPGTTLLRDERVWGQPAKCSFVTYRGGKAIVCNAL